MLHDRVIDAVKADRFRIHSIETIDQAIAILTGMEPGEADAEGNYPPDSFYGTVAAKLKEFADVRQRFAPMQPADKPREDE